MTTRGWGGWRGGKLISQESELSYSLVKCPEIDSAVVSRDCHCLKCGPCKGPCKDTSARSSCCGRAAAKRPTAQKQLVSYESTPRSHFRSSRLPFHSQLLLTRSPRLTPNQPLPKLTNTHTHARQQPSTDESAERR